jgi:dihydropteroate synthase
LQTLRIGAREFVWGSRTYVMGILNLTPDSFSGDGLLDPDRAVSKARQMEADGADLIDVGGESTRPETWSGPGLSAQEEMDRILPVIGALRAAITVPISVDTYKAEVAAAAIQAGADLVNDVWGTSRDPQMIATVARAGVPLVITHNRTAAEGDLVTGIADWLQARIAEAISGGIPEEHLIVDPGIGFRKNVEQNLEVVRRLELLRRLGRPILVGPSRKSFIGKTLDLPVDDRLAGTIAVATLCVARGADLVRVHDVREVARATRMADAILRG